MFSDSPFGTTSVGRLIRRFYYPLTFFPPLSGQQNEEKTFSSSSSSSPNCDISLGFMILVQWYLIIASLLL